MEISGYQSNGRRWQEGDEEQVLEEITSAFTFASDFSDQPYPASIGMSWMSNNGGGYKVLTKTAIKLS